MQRTRHITEGKFEIEKSLSLSFLYVYIYLPNLCGIFKYILYIIYISFIVRLLFRFLERTVQYASNSISRQFLVKETAEETTFFSTNETNKSRLFQHIRPTDDKLAKT